MRVSGHMRQLAVSCLAIVFTAAPATPAHADAADVDYHQWSSAAEFRTGTRDGTAITSEGVRLERPAGTIKHTEPGLGTTRDYDYASWTSPWHSGGFPATQLVASWNARTPPGTWLQVDMRGQTNEGETRWYTFGRWASGDTDIQRTSVAHQQDRFGEVNVDTFATRPGISLTSYQLRTTLYRIAGTTRSPTLSLSGAMVSAIPDRFGVPDSAPGDARGIELPVPRYSQNIHRNHYPQYGGGGEAWCSPTSTEMVVEYWGHEPSDDDLAWIEPGHPDPSVDHAARQTFDYAYDGTGNWPFNTAYAATYGLSAHITRLRSLDDIESLIQRGIPVITSQSFRAGELDGANYNTDGHIMVVIGFTPTGDVITNDPASRDDHAVRNVYRRHQFEDVWLRTQRIDETGHLATGSGGIAYLITPSSP